MVLMRALLVVFASVSGYLIVFNVTGSTKLANVGTASGFLIAATAILFEERVKRTPLRIVIGGAFGLIVGLVVANLLTYPLVVRFFRNSEYLELVTYLFTNFIIGYLGLTIGMKKGDELESLGIRILNSSMGNPDGPRKKPGSFLVDTSVIIDGRIAEVVDTGFIDGELIIPQFVLQELQYIADSSDPVRRVRGKRGLDILKQIQSSPKVEVRITDSDVPAVKEVDAKLVALAKGIDAKILTNDANLNKIAELQGVFVLNINKLATALKPVVMPGEILSIQVVREGKEQGQGVGYLEDGTMVVIDNGREHVGKTLDVSITSVLQTTGGRMIFSKAKNDIRRVASQ